MVLAHFHFEEKDSPTGKITAVYKDGKPLTDGMRLEMPDAIVQTYFKSALRNLSRMTQSEDDQEDNRHHGVQAFLMSLVGLEAFLNVYFHMIGREKNLPEIVDMATKRKINVETKIAHLPFKAFGLHLAGQKTLNKKARELYDLRSAIVHPKWEQSSFSMPGIVISGMVDNFQRAFEDQEFCRDALCWCALIIARIGMLQNPTSDYFVTRWTTLHETNKTLSDALGIPELEA